MGFVIRIFFLCICAQSWLSFTRIFISNAPSSYSQAEAKVATKSPEAAHDDNSHSRRKKNNPRKITREADDESQFAKPSSSSASNTAPLSSLTVSSIAISTSTPAASPYSPATDRARADDCAATPTPANQSIPSPVIEDAAAKPDPDSSPKTHSCLLCEKNFTERSVLNHHFSTVHGIEPYEMVPQASSSAQPLSAADPKNDDEFAESMMEEETIIYCEVCRREFQDRASLWLHMVHAHREEASVSCGICLKICCDNITLIEHVNTAHSGDKAVVQRRYSCQVCGRQHDSRQKLLKHATLHTLIDNQGQTIQPEEMISLNNAFAPRECPICHRKFFNEEKLNQHTQNFHSDAQETSTNSTFTTTLSPAVVYRCELCSTTHANRMDRWWHVYYSHSDDKRVTCDHGNCAKIFVTQSLRDEHCATHHQQQGEYTNTCEVCGKLWESRTVFYKHMMNVHPKCLPTICGVCMKIFSSVPELRTHVTSQHPQSEEATGIRCDVCGRQYAERSKMLRHRRVHNVTDGVPAAQNVIKRKDDLICSACPQITFERLEDIAEHRRTIHQLFVCDLCPKFYNGNNHLWKHVSKQHKGDPNVTCNLCLRTSASRAHLERHKIKYHSDPVDKLINRPLPDAASQEHKCSLCAKVFRIRSLLKKHLKSCKGVKVVAPKMQPVNGMFPCSKCPKVFEQQSVLSKHMRNSHVVHFCEACDEAKVGFDSKTELLDHIRTAHRDHPELVCDVDGCNKVLRQKADLQKHKQEHLRGYFTYICDMCGDMFSNRKKLRKHLLTFHKSHVQHLCAVCVAISPTIEELVEHVHANHPVLLHRPFTCQICGKCYPSGCKVVDHIGHAHGKEYKPCRVCWKIFTDERQLEEHTQNHPPAEEKPQASSSQVRKDSRSRASKASLAQELSALGITFETNENGKRGLDDEPLDFEEGGKRLRRKYKCTSCKETFRLIEELKEHKLEMHGSSQVSVTEVYEEAELVIMTSAEAKSERWTDYRPIECDCCGKQWNSKKQLWQHLIRSHPIQSMHTCGICLQVCKSYFSLWYHLDALHPYILNDPGGRFACYVCGHYHNSQSKLDKHIGVHKEPPLPNEFRCQYCQRLYRSSEYFEEHVRRHEMTTAPPPKKETTPFGRFSIDSILKSKVSAKDSAGADDCAGADDGADDGEDDITEVDENDIEKMDEEEEEEEDLVELGDDDSDSDGGSCASVKELSCEENVFRGYDDVAANQLAPAKIGHLLSEQLTKGEAGAEMEVDLESDISYSSVENSPLREDDDDEVDDLVFNGGDQKTVASPADVQLTRYVNNNQKGDRGAVRDQKAQWRAEYFRRMADNERF